MLKTSEKIQIVSKEIEDTKKNQMEILELKNTITQTKWMVGKKRRGQRRESAKWNIEQKLANWKKRENRLGKKWTEPQGPVTL